MKRKTKSEPSLRDKLSAAYLEAFQKDFEANGVAVIEALRLKSPEKYSEIAARLIAATEPLEKLDKNLGNSMKEIGCRLLQGVGLIEPSDEQIEEAIAANDVFVATLEAIRDRAPFGEPTNGHAAPTT
jgi:hypothetical protein